MDIKGRKLEWTRRGRSRQAGAPGGGGGEVDWLSGRSWWIWTGPIMATTTARKVLEKSFGSSRKAFVAPVRDGKVNPVSYGRARQRVCVYLRRFKPGSGGALYMETTKATARRRLALEQIRLWEEFCPGAHVLVAHQFVAAP